MLAQTVDLNGDLDDQIAVLDVALDGAPRRALVLSFGGLLGYLGVNSDGLAIGLNLVLGGDWRPGLPPYLAIRHLLDQAGSVAEALAILRGLPLASSRSLTLCDPSSAAYVEIVDNELRLVEGPVGCTPTTSCTPTSPSRRRAQRLRAQLLAAPAGRGPGRPWTACRRPGPMSRSTSRVLSQPPICVADTGDIRRERTVAAVVMLPGSRRAARPARRPVPQRHASPSASTWRSGSEQQSDWFLTAGAELPWAPRVFCFPHAGGSPRVFLDWQARLGEDAEILAVCRPGREHRAAEPAPTIAELIDGAAAAITALTEADGRPCFLFGHSLGRAGRVRGRPPAASRETAAALRRVGLRGALAAALGAGAAHRQPARKRVRRGDRVLRRPARRGHRRP